MSFPLDQLERFLTVFSLEMILVIFVLGIILLVAGLHWMFESEVELDFG